MALYDDDELLISDSFGAPPPADMFMPQETMALAPQTGLGLDTQAPAPVFDAGPGMPPLSPGQKQFDARRAAFEKLSGADRFFAGIGEIGAALQGKPSPMEGRIKGEREDRLIKLQEFKVHTDALQDGVKMAGKLTGEARTQFVENYAKELDTVRPGLGDTYRSLSKQPDGGAVFSRYAEKSPTARALLQADPSGQKFIEALGKEGFMKTINAEIDAGVMPTLIKKGQTFKMGWQKLVPPEMAERFNKDGQITASELMEANDWIRENKPDMKALAFSDEDIQIINRNQDAFYGTLGILGPKDEADVRKDKMKRPAESEIGKIRADIASGVISKAEGEAKIAKLTKQGGDGDPRMTPATVSVNGKNVSVLVDKFGNYYDANTRQPIKAGIAPQITEADERRNREQEGKAVGVDNLSRAVDALERIAKNHPRSAAGLFSGPARGVEYVAGSLNPGGKGSSPATQAVQLRDSILQSMGNLTRMSNADRERIENALQVGSGGNPRNLPLAIELLRNHIKKEKAAVDAPKARPKPGGKAPSEMSNDELINALGGGGG